MIYTDFQNIELSLLGFGAMRLPTEKTKTGTDASIDEVQVESMISCAIQNGVNYFDTAYPYHNGESERVLGRILKKYPRDTYYLADKFPGHQISETYYPEEIFEEQLKKCQVEYFDFYLLHNVYENSIRTYTDPKWGIIDYFIRQKQLGRIRHLGFSSHGGVKNLEEFLQQYGQNMEFCQIQLNYIDWTLQQAKEKYELLTKYNIPVWVMEPVRGGRLANLAADDERKLKELRPDQSIASWAFRWLFGLKNVHMILSGMSNLEQMRDNIVTFSKREPLKESEQEIVYAIAESMKNSIPCTACRYCCDGCPKGLDIPALLSFYNEIRFSPNVNIGMRLEAIPKEKWPSACIACGKCADICPQKIKIPDIMRELDQAVLKLPSWAEICRQRAEAAKRGRDAG